ncbi:hypothetical protein L3X38_033962 [Prunus dulcis]|uniref:Uncharacterized protein n=1 Tax=Prunus dulcis TaxID=3755 RepID=A0AAD4VID6_PRUDU|nr:hypothetical protein L3X38_033962 [Prunus dulcis]
MSTSTTMSSATEPKKLHIALFPWLAFGRIIPFFEIPLPRVENLPENAEATMDVPCHVIPYLKIAHDGLEQGISNFLQTNKLDWIIHDFAPHWLPPIASSLGTSRAHFSIFNASTLCFIGPTSPEGLDRYGVRTLPEHFTVPPEWIPFPSNLVFRSFEAKKLFDATKQNASGVSDLFRVKSTVQGLMPPVVQAREDKEDWSRIYQWLDKQENGSVVYIALGSELNLSQEDFSELALGLELSGLPFFWVLRTPSWSGDNDSVKLPDGFEERTKGRGLVWTTWAPQTKILAHDSIGGFLTHCGWSSLIEALQYGRPLIMLPFLYDQGLIARFWDKKIGIEVPRNEEDGSFTRKWLADSLNLVVVDEEGKAYRDGAKEQR